MRSRPVFVAYPTDSRVERVAKSVVQTPEQGVEQYINMIIAEQAKVNECTRLIDAECMLKLFPLPCHLPLSTTNTDTRSSRAHSSWSAEYSR